MERGGSFNHDLPNYKRKGNSKLLGFYCITNRKEDFNTRLQTIKRQFEQDSLSVDNPQEFSLADKNLVKDTTAEDIECEKNKLAEQIKRYQPIDGHFDRDYRTLHGMCGRLLLKLDELDTNTFLTIDLKGSMIGEVQSILLQLNRKMHPDGRCCEKCPLNTLTHK